MNVKQKIACQYCAAQGLSMNAIVQEMPAQNPNATRYGCDNGHYFAVPTETVFVSE